MQAVNLAPVTGMPQQPMAVSGQASGAPIAVGDLFSLTLQQLFAGLGAADAQPIEADPGNPDAQEQGDDMLAMLQQLLQAMPQAVLLPVADNASNVPEMKPDAGTAGAVSAGAAREPAVAALVQAGVPRAQAEELVKLLSTLQQAGPSADQPELKQLADQLRQWLKPAAVASETARTVPDAGGLPARPEKTPRSAIPTPAAWTGEAVRASEAAKPLHALRVNRALSAYQAETAVVAKTEAVGENPASPSAKPQSQPEQVEIGPARDEQPTPVGVKADPAPLFPANPPAPAREVVRAARLTDDLRAFFVKHMKIDASPGFTEARLILHPRSLGQVDVTITSENGVITAHFKAETAAGKELLDNQLAQLRSALTQQGVQVDRLVVTQQSPQDPSFGFQDQRGGQQQPQQQQKQPSREQQPETDFHEWVEALSDSDAGDRTLNTSV